MDMDIITFYQEQNIKVTGVVEWNMESAYWAYQIKIVIKDILVMMIYMVKELINIIMVIFLKVFLNLEKDKGKALFMGLMVEFK